jgi:solute:Na+ symporter, SSS family
MNSILFISMFLVLAIAYFIVGAWASRNIKNTSDYFLAGRSLGFIPVTFTLIATQVGGGMLLGTSAESYRIGYYGILYTIGISLGFLLLGLGFASKLQGLNVATTAELFETHYHSVFLKKIASFFSIMSLCGILIAQIVAARSFILSLGIHNEYVLILFWAVVVVCTMAGGLKAVAATDTFQLSVIVAAFTGIFLYVFSKESWSFFSPSSIATQQSLFTTTSFDFGSLVSIALMPALFVLIEQDMAQRFFAARTKKIATSAAFASSAFLLIFSLVPVYFGIKAKMMGLVFEGNSPLMPTIAALAGDFALALAALGVIAAITSTADSLLCAVSSNISQDFKSLFSINRSHLATSKLITLAVGIIVLIASYLVPQNIIEVLIGSYELSVSCLLVPLLFSYFSTNLKKNAAIGAIVFGFAGFIGFKLIHTIIPHSIAALALSLLGYWIGGMVKQK